MGGSRAMAQQGQGYVLGLRMVQPRLFSRALLEPTRPGLLDVDLLGVDDVLAERGFAVELVLLKHLVRGRAAVNPQTFVAGHLGFVEYALRQLGIAVPEARDYPAAAERWFGRRVWPSSLGEARNLVEEDGDALFIKPRGTAKRFTVRVFGSPDDFRGLQVTSREAPVWCSEVVELVSEHRAFVLHGEVLDVRPYWGDSRMGASETVVQEVTVALGPDLPAGCAIDFAVRDDGRTVFLELNDGYSLGRYGLPARSYADLLVSRWAQLVSSLAD